MALGLYLGSLGLLAGAVFGPPSSRTRAAVTVGLLWALGALLPGPQDAGRLLRWLGSLWGCAVIGFFGLATLGALLQAPPRQVQWGSIAGSPLMPVLALLTTHGDPVERRHAAWCLVYWTASLVGLLVAWGFPERA